MVSEKKAQWKRADAPIDGDRGDKLSSSSVRQTKGRHIKGLNFSSGILPSFPLVLRSFWSR